MSSMEVPIDGWKFYPVNHVVGSLTCTLLQICWNFLWGQNMQWPTHGLMISCWHFLETCAMSITAKQHIHHSLEMCLNLGEYEVDICECLSLSYWYVQKFLHQIHEVINLAVCEFSYWLFVSAVSNTFFVQW